MDQIVLALAQYEKSRTEASERNNNGEIFSSQMSRKIFLNLQDFKEALKERMYVRLNMSRDCKSIFIIVRKNRLALFGKEFQFRISPDLDSFSGPVWKYKISKYSKRLFSNAIYAERLKASCSDEEVIAFLLRQSIRQLQ
jgi:hypothetical protein